MSAEEVFFCLWSRRCSQFTFQSFDGTLLYLRKNVSLFCTCRMACFERVSVFLTQENLVAQIWRHYTMQVKTYIIN